MIMVLGNLFFSMACSFMAGHLFNKRLTFAFLLNIGAALFNAYYVIVFIIKHL